MEQRITNQSKQVHGEEGARMGALPGARTLGALCLLSAIMTPHAAAQAFGPPQFLGGFTPDPWDHASADLDGDGDEDLLVAYLIGPAKWFENDGSGQFVAEHEIVGAVEVRSIDAADLDGDGDMDLVISTGNWVQVLENQSGGIFSNPIYVGLHQLGICVKAEDLDGDGDADVLSASSDDDKIVWYENLGSLSFGAQQVITTDADYPRGVYATDLDGDGDADVVSASSGDDKIAWYENLGSGAFGPQQVITTAADLASSVHATDLDGDGDADVLSASEADDKIAWYENLGSGSFGAQQVITTDADDPVCVYATDLDRDGDADVLSASRVDDKIAWYENLGGGAFGPQQVIDGGAIGVRTVHAADLDGDFDPDLVASSVDIDRVAVFENRFLGVSYCTLSPNSVGPGARISATGSRSLADGDLTITTFDIPDQPGIVFFGPYAVSVPFGNGVRCVGGDPANPLVRLPVVVGSGNVAETVLDFSGPAAAQLQPGFRRFQHWFRDPAAGGAFFNLSDAITIFITP